MVKHGERKRFPLEENSIRLTISLPAKDYRYLAAEAARMRVSLAWVIRRAVSSYLVGTSVQVSGTGRKAKGRKQ